MPGRQPEKPIVELLAIVGEVHLVLAGRGEDRHTVLRPNGRRDVAPGGIAGSSDSFHLHVEIVKIEDDETLGDGFRRSGWGLGGFIRRHRRRRRSLRRRVGMAGLHRESQNILRLAIVEQPEVLLAEVAHRAVLAVAYHHPHRHQVAFDVKVERWVDVMGLVFMGLDFGWVGVLRRRAGAGGQQPNRKCHTGKKVSTQAASEDALERLTHRSSSKKYLLPLYAKTGAQSSSKAKIGRFPRPGATCHGLFRVCSIWTLKSR